MGQNKSSAVMQQRREPPDSADDFPTPLWATRALIQHVLVGLLGLQPQQLVALEPACNRGFMARPMEEYFKAVWASDVHDYGYAGMTQMADFLFPGWEQPVEIDFTMTNPPFRAAQEFIAKALNISRLGCAMLVRTSFLEGGGRYRNLFSKTPPTVVAQFAERVIMHKGVLRDPSKLYWDKDAGKMRRPSTATSYCWMVWMHDVAPRPFQWIPPCRLKLEKPGDYPVWPELGAEPPPDTN